MRGPTAIYRFRNLIRHRFRRGLTIESQFGILPDDAFPDLVLARAPCSVPEKGLDRAPGISSPTPQKFAGLEFEQFRVLR